MRTTASFAATPRLPNWQSDLNPANKWFRSLFWERTVFSLLAKVEGLPPDRQGEIATRVGKYINFARTARDDATLTRFIDAAAGERAKVAPEAKSTANPRWTAAALAEAWCVSRLGISNGTLNRLSGMSVSTAIEAFASGGQLSALDSRIDSRARQQRLYFGCEQVYRRNLHMLCLPNRCRGKDCDPQPSAGGQP